MNEGAYFGITRQYLSPEEIRENNDKLAKVPLMVNGSYLDENNQKYEVNEALYINDFMGSIVIDNPIEQHLLGINTSHKELLKEIKELRIKH